MEITRNEFALMSEVANRGLMLFEMNETPIKKIDLMMDLEYAHEECAMDFEKFLAFDDGDFAHDIFGIYQNFNRETKKMDNCFLPRATK